MLRGECDAGSLKGKEIWKSEADGLSRCAPRLSPDAAEMLSSHFVGIRKQVQQVEKDNDERSSIPITVRSVSLLLRLLD